MTFKVIIAILIVASLSLGAAHALTIDNSKPSATDLKVAPLAHTGRPLYTKDLQGGEDNTAIQLQPAADSYNLYRADNIEVK